MKKIFNNDNNIPTMGREGSKVSKMGDVIYGQSSTTKNSFVTCNIFLYLVSVQSIILLINNSKSLIEVCLETFLRSCLVGIWQLLQDF